MSWKREIAAEKGWRRGRTAVVNVVRGKTGYWTEVIVTPSSFLNHVRIYATLLFLLI